MKPYGKIADLVLLDSFEGIALITDARHEQASVHSYTAVHDFLTHENGELQQAATAIILCDCHYWPSGWPIEIYHNIIEKPTKERFAHAGAFCAAEIDRLNIAMHPDQADIYHEKSKRSF